MISAPEPRLLSLGAFLNRARPHWLVNGLLPAGEMVVLFGAPGGGKSFVALELAGCVSQGREFAGRLVRPGRVLVLIAEGCDGVRDRLDIMEKEGRLDRTNILICDSACQIGNASEREALLTALRAQDFAPDLIVVDTLARHAVGMEESSAKEMGTWIAGVQALVRAFSCTLLVVHHVGKSERRGMRGSSALPGAVSTAIACEKNGNFIKLKCEKQKDADEFEPFGFRAKKVTHGDVESLVLDYGDAGKPTLHRLKPNQIAMLSTLEAAFPNSVMRAVLQSIKGALIPDSTFDRDIKELIALGHAERISQGEYLLRKSPSPNDPQRSPMGMSCASDKSPPAPPPYKGGGVGIGAEVQEVIEVSPSKSAAASVGGYLERIEVPTFTELNAWPLPNQRYKEWLKH